MSESAPLPSPEDVLRATVDITRAAVNASSEAAVADAIVRISAQLIGADQGTLGQVLDDEVITIAAFIPPRQPVGSHFPVGFGVAGWVAATGRPAEIADVRQDKRYVALPYPEVRSFVGLPLCADGELIGVLSLAAWRQAAFAPNTADALQPLADHAALLLRHSAANRELRERVTALETATRDGLAESLHELKSPLHAAAGFVELVADEHAGPLNEQQKDFLSTARTEFGRVKDVLATLVQLGAAASSGELRPERAVSGAARLADHGAGEQRTRVDVVQRCRQRAWLAEWQGRGLVRALHAGRRRSSLRQCWAGAVDRATHRGAARRADLSPKSAGRRQLL